MFKRIKNFFSKRSKNDSKSGISIHSNGSEEIYIDIMISDECEESIHQFSKILSMFNPTAFIEINNILKYQCKTNQEQELYLKIIEHFIQESDESFLMSGKKSSEPCIEPDQML